MRGRRPPERQLRDAAAGRIADRGRSCQRCTSQCPISSSSRSPSLALSATHTASAGDIAAIDHHIGASHKRGAIAGPKKPRGSDFLGVADATKPMQGAAHFAHPLQATIQLRPAIGFDATGRDRVDANMIAGVVEREAACQADYAALGSAVGRQKVSSAISDLR